MTRSMPLKSFLSAVALALMATVAIPPSVTPAAAQDATRNAQERACSRDVSRHCRKLMNDGDFAIQQCLLQNRGKLCPACRKVVEGH